MKRKILVLLFVIGSLLTLTGCEKKEGGSSSEPTTTAKQLDHKVYKYMRITSNNAMDLYLQSEYMFDGLYDVGYKDDTYQPTLLVEFDTTTGKATKVTLYSFFLDDESNEWVNKAIDKCESSTSSYKKDILSLKKGRVNSGVSYLEASINPDSYAFEQHLDTYLFDEQDIETYIDRVYTSQLYNYSTTPEKKQGDNYFWTTLTSTKIEWSDSEFKAY